MGKHGHRRHRRNGARPLSDADGLVCETDPGCDEPAHRIGVMECAFEWSNGARFTVRELRCGCTLRVLDGSA